MAKTPLEKAQEELTLLQLKLQARDIAKQIRDIEEPKIHRQATKQLQDAIDAKTTEIANIELIG